MGKSKKVIIGEEGENDSPTDNSLSFTSSSPMDNLVEENKSSNNPYIKNPLLDSENNINIRLGVIDHDYANFEQYTVISKPKLEDEIPKPIINEEKSEKTKKRIIPNIFWFLDRKPKKIKEIKPKEELPDFQDKNLITLMPFEEYTHLKECPKCLKKIKKEKVKVLEKHITQRFYCKNCDFEKTLSFSKLE